MRQLAKVITLSVGLLTTSVNANGLPQCSEGKCVEQFKQFKKAAKRGHVGANYNTGKFYYFGYGTDVDRELALKYYRKAAVQGAKEAQYMTGVIYLTNEELYDFKQATKWLNRADKFNHPHAPFLLGKAYISDNDYKDYQKADAYLSKSFDLKYAKLPTLIEQLIATNEFNETNFPELTNRLIAANLWIEDGKLSDWLTNDYERLTVAGNSLENSLDMILASYRSRNNTTGSRLNGDCVQTASCKRKSLNEMKDSMWVSRK